MASGAESVIPAALIAFTGLSATILMFAIVWVVLGIAAFIHSIVCMGRTPSMSRALIGLLMAIFFGPFYWIYWYADGEYCRSPPYKPSPYPSGP